MINLLRLAELTDRPIFQARAVTAIQAYSGALAAAPVAMPTVALAAQMAPNEELVRERDLVSAELRVLDGTAEEGWQRFELHLSIRQGWHLNANPASDEFLVPTRLAGELRSVVYPEGRRLELGFARQELQVYDGEIVIEGEVAISQSGIELAFQACDDRRCLPPETRVLTFPGQSEVEIPD